MFVFDSIPSDFVNVTSGVLQGSVDSSDPFYFLLSLLDYQLSTTYPCVIKYADDITIAFSSFREF